MVEGFVLLNGEIVKASEARVSVFDRGLLYGDGFFETMRAESGHVLFLRAHLERLNSSCKLFNIRFVDDLGYWSERISLLLEKNGLTDIVAHVKVLVTRGPFLLEIGLPEGIHPTTVVYARKYEPLPELKYENGIALEIYPHARHSFIAEHKSLNYLFYLSAREWAKDQGGDEAIILNSDGTISEGATTNVIYVKDGVIYRPSSPYRLCGTMENEVIALLEGHGRNVGSMPTTPSILLDADEVFLTNSLLTAISASRIGNKTLPGAKPVATLLRQVDWRKRSYADRIS